MADTDKRVSRIALFSRFDSVHSVPSLITMSAGELGFLVLGFLLFAGPALLASIKLLDRFTWLESRFDKHQEKLREIGSYVVDVNERLWGAGILTDHERKLKELDLSHRNQGTPIPPNYRKWDL